MCELCGKSFTCGANLNIHKTEVHKLKIRKSQKLGSSNEPKKCFCHICGKPYCSKQVLRKHMIKHNNEDSLGMSIDVYVNTFYKPFEEFLVNINFLREILPKFGLKLDKDIGLDKMLKPGIKILVHIKTYGKRLNCCQSNS